MTATLLSGAYLPFSLALGLLAGLLALELVMLLVGGSLFAGDGGADGIAVDTTFDVAPGVEADVDALLAASAEGAPATQDAPVTLLGLGRVPFAIWLAAVLLGFGLTGVLVQAVSGAVLPGWLAAIPAALAGLGFARRFAGVFARMVPQHESTATGPQFLGGLRGVVSQGTARAGHPAEVRLRDRHGNTHYLRCTPFRDADVIAEGTAVLTLRERNANGGWGLRILPIPND